MPASPSQINTAITALIERLAVFTASGILVRTVNDRPSRAGRSIKPTKGTITISYNGDEEWLPNELLDGFHQTYKSQYLISGRFEGLKDEYGFYVVRDVLFRATLGQRIAGYRGPIEGREFRPTGPIQGRADTYWGFDWIIAIPGLYVSDAPGLNLGEDSLLPSGDEVLLAEVFVNEVEVSDQWDINTDTIEFQQP
jgi:hypothetical protein